MKVWSRGSLLKKIDDPCTRDIGLKIGREVSFPAPYIGLGIQILSLFSQMINIVYLFLGRGPRWHSG